LILQGERLRSCLDTATEALRRLRVTRAEVLGGGEGWEEETSPVGEGGEREGEAVEARGQGEEGEGEEEIVFSLEPESQAAATEAGELGGGEAAAS
jgi:hypothetical protein